MRRGHTMIYFQIPTNTFNTLSFFRLLLTSAGGPCHSHNLLWCFVMSAIVWHGLRSLYWTESHSSNRRHKSESRAARWPLAAESEEVIPCAYHCLHHATQNGFHMFPSARLMATVSCGFPTALLCPNSSSKAKNHWKQKTRASCFSHQPRELRCLS